MLFNVFNGEYPFNKQLGQVTAADEIQALKKALAQYATPQDRHVVVEPDSVIYREEALC